MVSRIIALKALSKLTGLQDLNVFHQVLFINGGEVGNPDKYNLETAAEKLEAPTIELDDKKQPELDDGRPIFKEKVKKCYMVKLDFLLNQSESDYFRCAQKKKSISLR